MLIAGIDIGGTSVKCGLIDPVRGVLLQQSFPTGRIPPEDLVAQIVSWVRSLPEPPAAVGVGSAGNVNTATNTIKAGNLGWHDVPLRAMLAANLSVPVWVDNDAQAALAAEVRYGACQGLRHVVYLTLGTGVGGALLLDGRPYRGHDNVGAELGHMITHAGGRSCVCGRRGCLEQYASATALKRYAKGMPVREVLDRLQAQDPGIVRAFDHFAREVAIGLSSLTAIFAPERLVLGGGVSHAGPLLLEAVARHFGGPVSLARHGNDAGMLGAAALAGLHANLPGWSEKGIACV